MAISFLEQMKEIPDHRITGMVTYPLDEILLATLVGVLCAADDWEAIELLSREYLAWLKQYLPYKTGVPHAQTFRKVFRLLKPEVLEQCFASWVASLQETVARNRGKKSCVAWLRSSFDFAQDEGQDAARFEACGGWKRGSASSRGLCLRGWPRQSGNALLTARATRSKPSPIFWRCWRSRARLYRLTPSELRQAIAAKIVAQEADYVLALKGNQSALHVDVKRFFEDAELAKACAVHKTTDAGHGRIEQRECPRDGCHRLADSFASRLAKLARHRRHHGKAHRQENRTNIRRNALVYNISASRPYRDPCSHACTLGNREQSPLAAGYNLRRGSLPDKKRFRTLEPRHCSPHRLEHAQARHLKIIPQAQPPEGFRQPRLQGSAACLLTI